MREAALGISAVQLPFPWQSSSTNAVLGIALILGLGVSSAVALGWRVLCIDRTWKAKPDLVHALCQPRGKPHSAPGMWPKFQETEECDASTSR